MPPAERGRSIFEGVLRNNHQALTLAPFPPLLVLRLHAERGRSIFEGVLRNYPKRLDLWSVYLDQEVGLGDEQRIR